LESQALPYIVLLAFFWGSNLVVSRFGLAQFNPVTFVALRLLLAAVLHALIYAVDRKRFFPTQRTLWRRAALLGVVGTAVPMTAIIASLSYLSSGMTAVFVTTAPAITVIMAHFLLPDEPLNRRRAFGIILALGGALLLALSGETGLPDSEAANPLGFSLVMCGILFGSGAAVYSRKYLREFDAFDVASIRIFFATVTVMVVTTVTIGFDLSEVNPAGYGSLLYAAVFGAFGGLLLEFWIIQRFGATSAAITTYIIPIFAAVGGTLFLDERITPIMIAGMAFIIAGIAIINRRRYVIKTDSAPTPP
jgi:drug/metabolite transporter (DMT)-like permease